MTPTQPQRSAWTTVACVAVAFVAYVISVGPVCALVNHGYFPPRAYIIGWNPVWYVGQRIGAEPLLTDYCHFCTDRL